MSNRLCTWWLFAAVIVTDFVISTDPCICLKTFTTNLYSPIHLEFRGDAYFIAEQRGIVRYFQTLKSPDNNGSVLLDIRDRVVITPTFGDERGLLGFTLHPHYNENGKFYVFYIGNSTGYEYSQLSEFKAVDNVALPSTERFLIRIDNLTKHGIAGQLLFGHDDLLYISIGDGTGDEGPPVDGAQDPSSFYGKILRVDVDRKDTDLSYGIPPTNPFVGKSPWKEEVFAYGCRDMWRCSQDMMPDSHGERRVFCADPGASRFEEINIIRSGRNYGWNIKEGLSCYHSLKCNETLENEELPIHVYGHTSFAHAVVGGHVYRGSDLPHLYGRYLYGDALSSNLSLLTETSDGWTSSPLPVCSPEQCPCDAREVVRDYVLAYGQDKKGEVYVLTTSAFAAFTDSAVVLKIVPSSREKGLTCGANKQTSTFNTRVWTIVLLVLMVSHSS